MKKFNILIKVILPLFVGLFLIAAISIFSYYYFLKENISKNSQKSFSNMTLSFDHIIDKDTKLMEGLIEQLKKDQKTIDLFKNNHKDWLFMYLHQTYVKLNKNYGLTHFYIHKANKENYIRVHNKNKNSDIIDRITLEKSANKLVTTSGVEFGITHNLVLRVVSPWIEDGELIGFIELGKEVDLITKEYTDLAKSDIIFTIKKEFITKKDFDKWKSKNYKNRYYYAMDNYYIIDSTIDKIEEELQNKLNLEEVCINEYVENDEKKYFINSKNYYDISKQYVGKIFVLNDVSDEYNFLYTLIVKITVIIFILVVILLYYYINYIKETENSLNKAYKEIQDISIHDGLTKLYNKQYYLDTIPLLLKTCSRFNFHISFILIDIDNFKKYNDNYGHLKGDEVLKAIGKSILTTFKRDNDYCFRVGGEEFLVVTASQDDSSASYMANLLCKNIEELNIEHKYNADFGVVTASLGFSTRKIIQKISIEKLYDEADKGLYLSKNNGRNQVTFYDKKESKDEN